MLQQVRPSSHPVTGRNKLCGGAGLSSLTLKKHQNQDNDFCIPDAGIFKVFKSVEKNPSEIIDLRLQRKFCHARSCLLEAHVLPLGCYDLS